MLDRLRKLLGAAVILAALSASPAWTQTAQQATPAAPTAPPEPTYVTEKGFKSRAFEVKSRDTHQVLDAVRPLGSGFKGALMSANRELQTLTVRDFPENLATIEEALKRLDVPEEQKSDVQLRLYVLLGSPYPSSGPPPEELKEVLASLHQTLNFKGYGLVATFEQRVKDGSRQVKGSGVADAPEPPNAKGERDTMQLEYRIDRIQLETPGKGPASVKLSGFAFDLMHRGRASIQTDLSIRDGEKVVVGTSTLKDKALVLVLVARVVR